MIRSPTRASLSRIERARAEGCRVDVARDQHRPGSCAPGAAPSLHQDVRRMFGLASSSPFATLMPAANTGASMPSDRMVTRVGARESCAATCFACAALAAAGVDRGSRERGLRHERALRLRLGDVRRRQDALAVGVEAGLREPHARATAARRRPSRTRSPASTASRCSGSPRASPNGPKSSTPILTGVSPRPLTRIRS